MECVGYIEGAVDGLLMERAANGRQPCPPPHTTERQLQDAVLLSLRAHPERRNDNADFLVVLAIGDAWGCR
jgi:Rap1a immunity proteins